MASGNSSLDLYLLRVGKEAVEAASRCIRANLYGIRHSVLRHSSCLTGARVDPYKIPHIIPAYTYNNPYIHPSTSPYTPVSCTKRGGRWFRRPWKERPVGTRPPYPHYLHANQIEVDPALR